MAVPRKEVNKFVIWSLSLMAWVNRTSKDRVNKYKTKKEFAEEGKQKLKFWDFDHNTKRESGNVAGEGNGEFFFIRSFHEHLLVQGISPTLCTQTYAHACTSLFRVVRSKGTEFWRHVYSKDLA